MKKALFLLLFFSFTSCCRVSKQIEPKLELPCHPKFVQRETRIGAQQFHASPFEPLTQEELATDWGKEYQIAFVFAQDFDLFRAITAFKRSLILLNRAKSHRHIEINYFLILCYYLGEKYIEVVYLAEPGLGTYFQPGFKGYEDLLVMLYDSYEKIGQYEKAQKILSLLELEDIEKTDRLLFFSQIERANFPALYVRAAEGPNATLARMLCCYEKKKKSICKAKLLNAVLPGAGYLYLGQKSTAFTALAVNALFIGASVHFFYHHNIPAGILFLSMESGWYFGGINGAGLCAKSYNERLYESYLGKVCTKYELFPLYQLNFAF